MDRCGAPDYLIQKYTKYYIRHLLAYLLGRVSSSVVESGFLVGPILGFTLGSLEDHVRVNRLADGLRGTSEKPVATDFKERDC